MVEIINFLGIIKSEPTFLTLLIVIIAIITTLILRIKDADIKGITSISSAQNEKLISLMTQNEKLMNSVSFLQGQIQMMNDKMLEEANEHRLKMEQTYKVIDDMRRRIMELEDMVRVYQNTHIRCTKLDCVNRVT